MKNGGEKNKYFNFNAVRFRSEPLETDRIGLQFCRYMEGKVFLFHIGIKSQRELQAGHP